METVTVDKRILKIMAEQNLLNLNIIHNLAQFPQAAQIIQEITKMYFSTISEQDIETSVKELLENQEQLIASWEESRKEIIQSISTPEDFTAYVEGEEPIIKE